MSIKLQRSVVNINQCTIHFLCFDDFYPHNNLRSVNDVSIQCYNKEMVNKLFQHKIDYSSSSHAVLDTSSRKRKAAKIQAILEEVTDFSKAKVLDIGTGSGNIAHELSKNAKTVSSVDIVDERKEKSGYDFKLTNDESLPFDDEMFDIVIANHVIEHMPDQTKHISEVMRVLKPGGYLYLATPNKYWFTDPHYKLPFISWLPRSISAKYLKIIQKATWNIYPLSSITIKKMLHDTELINALPLLMTSDASKKLDKWKSIVGVARYVPKVFLDITKYISPTLIFIIRKPASKK